MIAFKENYENAGSPSDRKIRDELELSEEQYVEYLRIYNGLLNNTPEILEAENLKKILDEKDKILEKELDALDELIEIKKVIARWAKENIK